jgi:hypothetical protein
MAHVVKLRVKDTTASTGTGTKVLARTSTLNFRTFDAVMANGDTCDAIVINRSANQWEHSSWTIAGVGSEPALTRLEFKESSTGAPVHFTEGTKDVLMLYPVAGKLDFTARTLKLAPNIIDGTPGTTSAFRFYDDGNGWIGGVGVSSGAVDIRSGWNLNLWSGQTGSQRNTIRVNQNGLGIAVGAAVAAGIEPQAALHVVNRGGAPSAIITTSTSTAVRIGPNGASSAIEGVDYTGLNVWRPLFVNGDVVILGAQGYEAMRISANRNVLIGTTVESAKLSIGLDGVADPSNYGKAIQITRGPSGGQQIAFIRNGAQVASLGYKPGSNAFGFGLGTTVDANFWPNWLSLNNGNVGIGIEAPGSKLDVMGATTGLTENIVRIGNAGANRYMRLGVHASGANQYPFIQAYHTNSDANPWKFLLNPYGREVGVGGIPGDGVLLDVMGDMSGAAYSHFRVINYGTTGAQARTHMTAGGRTAGRVVDYDGQYLFEVGHGLTTRYSDFDNHHWRSNSGAARMQLTAVGVGIGRNPGAPLDVWSSTVGTGYDYIAQFGVNNGVSAHTRMLFGQNAVNSMFLEVANQDNTKGVLTLQPFGGSVIAGGSYAADRGQFSVQASVAGNLMSLIHNDSAHANAYAEHRIYVGGKYVRRLVGWNGSHLQELATGVTTRYSDFDLHSWRNNAGAEQMRLSSGALGIGGVPLYRLDVIYNNDSYCFSSTRNGSLGNWASAGLLLDLSAVPNAYATLNLVRNGGNPVLELATFSGVTGGIHIVGKAVRFFNSASTLLMALENTGQLFIGNASEPSTPSGGGYLFVSAGALKWKGSAGTVTTIANA